MDCEKIRDRFSSLWEKELTPFEEKMVKEHLASCPECQSEFEQFEKTMRWLHSMGEVEVPDGFLPGIYKKMEDRKGIRLAEKSGKKWLNFPLPLKLPAQAVAMVAIVFLVLYLTKMMPQSPAPLSVGKKSEQALARSAAPSSISEGEAAKRRSGSTLSEPSPLGRGVEGLAQKELERGRETLKIPAEASRPKDVEEAKAPLPEEKKIEPTPRVEAEIKRAKVPSPKTEALALKQIESKEETKAAASSPEPGKIEKELHAKKKSVVAVKPPQEIVLKISDREKAISQVQELVKQFGGEMLTTKGNGFLASLPKDSFSDFEKELEGVSSSSKTDKGIMRKQSTGSLRALHEVKKEAFEGESGEPAKSVTDEEGRIVVRILLIQE